MKIRWRERTNKMQLIRCLLSNSLSQNVSVIIMPIIRRIRPCPTACDAAPQDHSQPQPTHPGRTPHAVRHGLILLMMGIMMPETCWDREFNNKHRISCILLVPSLHLMFTKHGHKNLKLSIFCSAQITLNYSSQSKYLITFYVAMVCPFDSI